MEHFTHYKDFDFHSECDGKPDENLGQRRYICFDLYFTIITLSAFLRIDNTMVSTEAGDWLCAYCFIWSRDDTKPPGHSEAG